MDATDEKMEPGGAGKAPPPPDEAARARAYLDLWERQLAWLALHGRPPAATTRRR
jgi:hypothetical protein